jgi:hypothetical protein
MEDFESEKALEEKNVEVENVHCAHTEGYKQLPKRRALKILRMFKKMKMMTECAECDQTFEFRTKSWQQWKNKFLPSPLSLSGVSFSYNNRLTLCKRYILNYAKSALS